MQAPTLPDVGGAVIVVCIGRVAVELDKSTFAPVNVLFAVKVLALESLADAASRAVILFCSVVSASVARLVSMPIAVPKAISAKARVFASAVSAA